MFGLNRGWKLWMTDYYGLIGEDVRGRCRRFHKGWGLRSNGLELALLLRGRPQIAILQMNIFKKSPFFEENSIWKGNEGSLQFWSPEVLPVYEVWVVPSIHGLLDYTNRQVHEAFESRVPWAFYAFHSGAAPTPWWLQPTRPWTLPIAVDASFRSDAVQLGSVSFPPLGTIKKAIKL